MKKILIVGYVISILWALTGIGVASIEILNTPSDSISYSIGEYIGAFLVITTPFGIVFAYQRFSNKKSKENKHAVQ